MTPFKATAASQNRIRSKQSIDETGVPRSLLLDLVARLLLVRGRLSLIELAEATKLNPSVVGEIVAFMRSERLVEANRSGATDADAAFQLSDAGRDRAAAAMNRSQYAGAAPVSLNEYRAAVKSQSVDGLHFNSAAVRAALAELVLPTELVDQLGAAMNSGRAVMLYGPAGSGKTYLAERFSELLPGEILVPHAITVGGEFIQVYDPLVHVPVQAESQKSSALVRPDTDERWVRCRRPVVITGGELTLGMLDIQFDNATRFYQAPPHVKANGGLLVVDDLGRQLVEPRQLMNRWIVPLDRRRDYLSLQNGFKFEVPFDLWVLFSTNLRPQDLADEAFLRRFGYKLFVGPMSVSDYRAVFEQVCAETGIAFDERAFDWLVEARHAGEHRPLLACYPRDLVGRIRDFAIYEGEPAVMSQAALSRAWETYFVSDDR